MPTDHSLLPVSKSSGAPSVLVVDDDPLLASTMTEALVVLGHACHETYCARDALTWLETEGPVDVVITDYVMPGMTGLQLAEHIKVRWPSMSVILVSGITDLPQPVDSAVRILPKPYGLADLICAIDQVVK
jgi:DNA-binding NtrC family response regulator